MRRSDVDAGSIFACHAGCCTALHRQRRVYWLQRWSFSSGKRLFSDRIRIVFDFPRCDYNLNTSHVHLLLPFPSAAAYKSLVLFHSGCTIVFLPLRSTWCFFLFAVTTVQRRLDVPACFEKLISKKYPYPGFQLIRGGFIGQFVIIILIQRSKSPR